MKGVTAVRAMLEAEAERVPGFSFGDFCTELSSSIELSNAPSRNVRFKREKKLFHQLVDYGDEFISLLFLKTRHGDELQGMSGVNILIKAARRGFGILFKQLIGHVTDVSAADKDGRTVLHHVSVHGNVKMAKLLVDKGADVNAQGGRYGNTLQAASDRGHREIVQMLNAAKKLMRVSASNGQCQLSLPMMVIKKNQTMEYKGNPISESTLSLARSQSRKSLVYNDLLWSDQ